MRSITQVLAAASMAAAMLATPLAFGQETMDADKFVKMCDQDKDGMVSKAEVMKMVEKMYDKHDAKKTGKLDKKQTEAFLKDLMKGGS